MAARATAQRPDWSALPAGLRLAIEERCGSEVVEATSQGGGFTNGFASRLLLADGARIFVKAAPQDTWVAESYRQEAEVVSLLPVGVDAAVLQWTTEADGWFAAGYADIAGRTPARPWRADELARVVEALTATAQVLTPAPETIAVEHFTAEFGPYMLLLDAVPGPHAPECRALADKLLTDCAATTLAHNDLRDDNILLAADGRVVLVDWNWGTHAPAWFDLVSVLIGPHGDGLAVEPILNENPLLNGVDPEFVDGFLALLFGYFRNAAAQPAVPTSPFLRAHQAWYRDAAWSWLAARRGWGCHPDEL